MKAWIRDLWRVLRAQYFPPRRYPYPRAGNGYYRLRSGTVVHLQAEQLPSQETLDALDELAQAAIRRMEAERNA